ncbi:LMF2, partial [Symbiodinium microadriaticum]
EIIPEFQLHGLIGLIRLLGPFRLISSYGVFPPEALPQVRTTLVYEGSQDGKTWKTYPYRYQPHSRESVPCRLAPHHARLDHRAHYPFEVTSKSDLTSAYSLTDHNPYCYSPVSFAHRVAQRLLEGEESVLGLFASNPFPEKAPAFVRVTGYGLSPCSIAHHQKTGNWWHAQQLCEVVPPRQTDPSIWQRWVPHAECFHPEHEVWRSRSGPVQALLASDPSDVDAAVLCEGISKDEVAAFWSEFIPGVQRARGDWASLPSRAREVAERTSPAKLALYERLLARYVLLLLRQVSPQLVQKIGIAILFGTWRLHLLLHDVVAEGKDAYVDTLRNPESLLPRAEKIQDPQLLDLLGLLRPADLQFEDCKFHYHYAAKQRPDRRGFLKSICEFDYGGMYSFVKFMAQQPSLSPLWLPKAELLNSGAWIVEGYQDQGEATASSLGAPLVRRVLFVKTVVGASLSSSGIAAVRMRMEDLGREAFHDFGKGREASPRLACRAVKSIAFPNKLNGDVPTRRSNQGSVHDSAIGPLIQQLRFSNCASETMPASVTALQQLLRFSNCASATAAVQQLRLPRVSNCTSATAAVQQLRFSNCRDSETGQRFNDCA